MIEQSSETQPLPGTPAARLLALGLGPAAARSAGAVEVEPRPELAGTGADLAMALGVVAAELEGPEMICVGVHARAQLVDLAVAAERVVAWATSVQARAVAALHRQFVAEHDLDQAELIEHELRAQPAIDSDPAPGSATDPADERAAGRRPPSPDRPGFG